MGRAQPSSRLAVTKGKRLPGKARARSWGHGRSLAHPHAGKEAEVAIVSRWVNSIAAAPDVEWSRAGGHG